MTIEPMLMEPSELDNQRMGAESETHPQSDRKQLLGHIAALENRMRNQGKGDNHGLDTDGQIFFYEQDFYPLSNFSAFTLRWKDQRFDTSEAVYHWEKFALLVGLSDHELTIRMSIKRAIQSSSSAHEAFKIAERNRDYRRTDWDEVKVGIMREIIRAKAQQHEYVYRKLLATGDRELIENSWRDSFWGWGPNRDGQNQLGKLWMELRSELRATIAAASQ